MKGEGLTEKLSFYVEGKQRIDGQKKKKKSIASIFFCCLAEV